MKDFVVSAVSDLGLFFGGILTLLVFALTMAMLSSLFLCSVVASLFMIAKILA